MGKLRLEKGRQALKLTAVDIPAEGLEIKDLWLVGP